jgi:hypothetical protein
VVKQRKQVAVQRSPHSHGVVPVETEVKTIDSLQRGFIVFVIGIASKSRPP